MKAGLTGPRNSAFNPANRTICGFTETPSASAGLAPQMIEPLSTLANAGPLMTSSFRSNPKIPGGAFERTLDEIWKS